MSARDELNEWEQKGHAASARFDELIANVNETEGEIQNIEYSLVQMQLVLRNYKADMVQVQSELQEARTGWLEARRALEEEGES